LSLPAQQGIRFSGASSFFRQPLREQINLKHPLVRLTDLINWERLGRVDE
jgi:hypothetical protein